MLGFEIDRDVIYYFVDTLSLVLLRLIVFFSMFDCFLFVPDFSRAENFAKVLQIFELTKCRQKN